jgi:hypothetical protein
MLYLRSRSDKRRRELANSGPQDPGPDKTGQKKNVLNFIPGARRRALFHSSSMMTGAWSEGRSQLRVALSITTDLVCPTSGLDTQT